MTEVADPRPLLALLASGLAIVLILASHRRPNVREGWSVVAAVAKFGIVASMVPGVLDGTVYTYSFGPFVSGVEFALQADPLGMLFASLASFLWIATALYATGYMRGLEEPNQTRFFAAFAASLSAAIGIAFSANLVTMFVFYELLSVATYPLVAHDETDEARAAGRKYLAYTFFGGGVFVLAGTVLVYWLTAGTDGGATVSFVSGGIPQLATVANSDPTMARVAFACLIIGFGVKAALMPLHSWLPDAMVAPTPVSGLLHAVAVVKAGAFGIARVVLDVYGPGVMKGLGLGVPLAAVAAVTIVTASVIALRQDNLKRRLAFSTVSQLSYIVLGLGLLSPHALVGGLLHIPAHAFMKLTLFFCAGAIHVETHTDDISDMAGIGKRMPGTMAAFAVASIGMAGIPLLAGFVSKWYLLIGSVDAGLSIFALALLASGILNIAYFWPIVSHAFFEAEDRNDAKPLIAAPLGGTMDLRADGGHDDAEPAAASEDDAETAAANEDELEPAPEDDASHGEHDHDAHHGGPPPAGWEHRGLRTESTWLMLGPILAIATGAVVLGVVPHAAMFLELVELIVAGATGVSV